MVLAMPDGRDALPALAARAQLGDREALERLLRNLQKPLGEHIRGVMRDDAAAQDVLQETLLLVCRRLNTLRQVEWVRAWAYRIATREAIRALRRRHRRMENPIDDAAVVAAPEADAAEIDEELLAALPKSLVELPPAAQAVVRLHYLHSLSQQEIAAILEIPIGTVKSRISYGLQRLRALMRLSGR